MWPAGRVRSGWPVARKPRRGEVPLTDSIGHAGAQHEQSGSRRGRRTSAPLQPCGGCRTGRAASGSLGRTRGTGKALRYFVA